MTSEAGASDPLATIMIIDDDPDVRESTVQLVEGLGYKAVAVEDADLAFEVAEQHPPDLILQDVKMGSLSAAGVMANLRTHSATSDAPVVLFSAGEELARTARRLGAVDYLAKPFSSRELQQVLERNLDVGVEPDWDNAVQEIRDTFHEYWNIILALGNYAEALKQSGDLQEKQAETLDKFGNTLLRLEAQTDRLRAFTLSLIPQTDTGEEGERHPARPGSRHTLSRSSS